MRADFSVAELPHRIRIFPKNSSRHFDCSTKHRMEDVPMKRLTRIGCVCACLGLPAPAAARADSLGVSSAVYEASFVRLAPELENGRPAANGASLFSWCKRCVAPDASPFLVSANLS